MEVEDVDSRSKLSESEVEQYDRQIRLWGLEAQKRLRSSRILVCGLTGVAAEVCKNIVLAGVKSLTVLDPNPFDEMELGARFLIPHGEESKPRSVAAVPRLQTLNPNVEVIGDSGSVEEKDEEFFTQFDVICLTNCSSTVQLKVNELCGKHHIKFYCTDTWGYYGYYFVDLGDHEYVEEVAKETEAMDVSQKKMATAKPSNGKLETKETKMEKKTLTFCRLEKSLKFDFSKLPPKYFKRNPKTYFIIRILQEFFNRKGRGPKSTAELEDKLELKTLRAEVLKAMSINDDVLDSDFSKFCFGELSPVCAIVGGVLAQEMIKALTAKEEPFNNHFIYDGYCGNGTVELIG